MLEGLRGGVWRRMSHKLDEALMRRFPHAERPTGPPTNHAKGYYLLGAAGVAAIFYGAYHSARMLSVVPLSQWADIAMGLQPPSARCRFPLNSAGLDHAGGSRFGTNPKRAAFLQPLVQIAASVPATGLVSGCAPVRSRLPGALIWPPCS